MAKKLLGQLKLQIPAGAANPSPPVGPALGQRGINIMEFCKAFNAKTEKMEKGLPLPVVIDYYQDKSFTFIVKTAPASVLLKKAAKLKKGSEPTRAYEPHAAIDGPPARPTPRHPPLDKDEDLLIQMNKAYLLALNPTNSGWYAELAICEEDAMAMREFFEAVRNHASHEQPALAFVPQMFDPSYEEAACGIAAKLMAKVKPHTPAA